MNNHCVNTKQFCFYCSIYLYIIQYIYILYNYCTALVVLEPYVYNSYPVLPPASHPGAAPAIHSVRVADLPVVPRTQPAVVPSTQLAHLRLPLALAAQQRRLGQQRLARCKREPEASRRRRRDMADLLLQRWQLHQGLPKP
jgi:hypothetical protein